MCIFLSTRAHPDYPFILASNRDEYFERATQPASFIDENTLCPIDLARPEHGTWIGVTKTGRLGVLVNYREPVKDGAISKISRGCIPTSFLHSTEDPVEWASRIRGESTAFEDVGGFSFFFGTLRQRNPDETEIEPMYIMSNRYSETVSVYNTPGEEPAIDLKQDISLEFDERQYADTLGMSNSPYLAPWPKVLHGKSYLDSLVREASEKKWTQDRLSNELFRLLSKATPASPHYWRDLDFDTAFEELPQTIFVPPIEKEVSTELTKITSGPCLDGHFYGTKTQTVILVDTRGHLTYIERNLHSSDDLSEKPSLHSFEFDIEGWK